MQSDNTEKQAPQTAETSENCAVFLKRGELSRTPAVSADKLPLRRGVSSKRFAAMFRCIVPAVLILSVLAGVSFAFTCLRDFDTDIGHVQHGSVWFGLMIGAVLLGLAGTVVLTISAWPVRQFRYPSAGYGETISAFMTAALLGVHALRQLLVTFTTAPVSASAFDTTILNRLSAAGLLLAALYFVCAGIGRHGAVQTALSLCGCVSMMLVLFRLYFDFSMPLNSPIRNLSMLACTGLLLFLLAETRVNVDLWYTGAPFTVFSHLSVILLTGVYGLGGLILSVCGVGGFSMIESAAYLSAAALGFFRLQQFPSLIGDHIPPPPTEDDIRKAAKQKKQL
ncbi:MAG: hypothetical protein IJX14_08050 [Clostridia bacterium]|nr:hypothetical protein [Clostridia bacterium]